MRAEGDDAVWRKMLRAKIHRATVTAGDIAYEGSITIDAELLRLADLVPYDAVDIYNVTNGSRSRPTSSPARRAPE